MKFILLIVLFINTAWANWPPPIYKLPSSTDGTILLFNGTTGAKVKQATGSGFVRATSGVYGTTASIDVAVYGSGTLPVTLGGTGRSTLTANAVILGNGTADVAFVTGSATGDVLTYNGSTWASSAPASSSETVSAKTATFTAACGNIYLTTNAISANLPSPSSGCKITIKKKDSNTVTVVRNGSESIDGTAASYVMDGSKEAITLVSDGTDWFII